MALVAVWTHPLTIIVALFLDRHAPARPRSADARGLAPLAVLEQEGERLGGNWLCAHPVWSDHHGRTAPTTSSTTPTPGPSRPILDPASSRPFPDHARQPAAARSGATSPAGPAGSSRRAPRSKRTPRARWNEDSTARRRGHRRAGHQRPPARWCSTRGRPSPRPTCSGWRRRSPLHTLVTRIRSDRRARAHARTPAEPFRANTLHSRSPAGGSACSSRPTAW